MEERLEDINVEESIESLKEGIQIPVVLRADPLKKAAISMEVRVRVWGILQTQSTVEFLGLIWKFQLHRKPGRHSWIPVVIRPRSLLQSISQQHLLPMKSLILSTKIRVLERSSNVATKGSSIPVVCTFERLNASRMPKYKWP